MCVNIDLPLAALVSQIDPAFMSLMVPGNFPLVNLVAGLGLHMEVQILEQMFMTTSFKGLILKGKYHRINNGCHNKQVYIHTHIHTHILAYPSKQEH